jgi:hypothetical protein
MVLKVYTWGVNVGEYVGSGVIVVSAIASSIVPSISSIVVEVVSGVEGSGSGV